MPPANTRNPSPPVDGREGARTPPSYISALSEALESPVTSNTSLLADTLITYADDTLYFRAAQDPDRPRLERSRDRLRDPGRERIDLEFQRPELDRVDLLLQRDRGNHLRRVLNRLSRLPGDSRAPYGDRVPSHNHLYDWSPATNRAAADDDVEQEELHRIISELRREQPNTHPDILRVMARFQYSLERDRSLAPRLLNSSQPSQSADSSLRSAAILQSVRRHSRLSARRRDSPQWSHADRDSASRSTHASYRAERWWPPATTTERRTSQDQARDQAWHRDMRARVDSYHRGYLERSTSTASTGLTKMENTIKYLSRIRYSNCLDDSLNHAIDLGFMAKKFNNDHHDFVVAPSLLPPPTTSSWLAPGAVLSGCQHATNVTSTTANTTMHRFPNNDGLTSTLFEPPIRPWGYSSARNRTRRAAPPETVTSHNPQQDRWPVKVTIHSVDYEQMSLSATMEAYNVPSHPHQHQSLLIGDTNASFTRTSSITTYLEGEILDFNTHTLLTESFKSSSANDATYWSKLPPFQIYSDEELMHNLSSIRWFEEVLSKEWILMRWKERCFVKPLKSSRINSHALDLGMEHDSDTDSYSSLPPLEPSRPDWGVGVGDAEHGMFDDSGCGLTISGFYYVCLRRSDGRLDGLYYDPQSSPYQCLKLESVKGGVLPAWEFK